MISKSQVKRIAIQKGERLGSGELLPCPFCGGTNIDESFARGFEGGDVSKPFIAAGCYDCDATGPDVSVPNGENGYKESIKAWNTRAIVEGK